MQEVAYNEQCVVGMYLHLGMQRTIICIAYDVQLRFSALPYKYE